MSDEIRIGDVERKYNQAAESLANWVEEYGPQRGLSPQLIMVLLLDKGVGLAVRQADTEDHARQVVSEVVEDHIQNRGGNSMSRTETAQNLLQVSAYSLGRSRLVLKVIPRKTNDNSSRVTAKGELRNSCSGSVRIGFMGLNQRHYKCYYKFVRCSGNKVGGI